VIGGYYQITYSNQVIFNTLSAEQPKYEKSEEKQNGNIFSSLEYPIDVPAHLKPISLEMHKQFVYPSKLDCV
jgi:hypothetical protein